jgi:PhoPQ-activated pathogenicity-related protein
VLVVGFAGSATAQAPAIPRDLVNYVTKADPSFAWKLVSNDDTQAGKVYTLDLTSQTWQGVKWEHKLQVYVPKGSKPTSTMLLWNQGGTPNATSGALGLALADKIQAPIAFLYGVPNQPIPSVGGERKEDALIAETFVRFLETEDPTWPLLFPMAKSLVRAMDTLQAFAKEQLKTDVTHFVVTGASKRGWTSWLTAASGDKRVKAIAPLVIDTLNFQAQMPNQLRSFGGKYSEMIHDYEERKLLPLPDTSVAHRLWAMVDPWVYRSQLTLPKMIINGTNDPYWAQDALNLYWDDLIGEKFICYVPNAGHDLRAMDTPNQPDPRRAKKEPFPMKGVNTLAAFAKHQIVDRPMPKLNWKHANADSKAVLTVESDPKPKAVRYWVADSETRDFRKSKWREQSENSTAYPEKGFRALMAEVEYEIDGLPFTLCTQLRILEAKK